MVFLAANGQPELALTQYDSCRQILWQTLAVEPGPTIINLAQTLERQLAGETAVSPKAHLEAPSIPGTLPPDSLLPYQRNRDFTGREGVLQQVATIFLDETLVTPPAVVITGMGGVGKTQMAVEFAYRYGHFFTGGVYWLGFSQAETVATEVALTGSERGMKLFHRSAKLTLSDQVGRVQRAWQEATPRLLIFDNCEDESLLAEWLPVTGGCRVLVTSRRAAWSREVGVTPLPLRLLAHVESISLLQKTAPHLTSTQAAQIADEVGHLPLALHLAGGFLHRYQHIHPAGYCQQLHQQGILQHPSLQGQGSDYSPTGHDLDVSRTFALSLEALEPEDEVDMLAQKLLTRAACFAPAEPIPIPILMATLSETRADFMTSLLAEDGLTRLGQLGFLTIEGRKTAVLHPLLARFTVQFLVDDSQAQADVETAVIQQLASSRLSNDINPVSIPVPIAHLQFIINAALPRQDAVSAKLASLIGCHLRDIGAYNQADAYLQQALAIRQQVVGPDHLDTAESFDHLGFSCMRQGQLDKGKHYYEQALRIHQQQLGPHHVHTAMSLSRLGTFYWQIGNNEMGRFYLEQALTIQEKKLPTNHLDTARTLSGLCIVHTKMKQYKLGQEYGERALQIRKQLVGDTHPLIAQSLNNLGKNYMGAGDYETAQQYMEKALTIWQQAMGEAYTQTAIMLSNLSMLFMKMAQDQKAKKLLEHALVIWEKTVGLEHPRAASALVNLGEVHWQMEEKAMARSLFERARPVLEASLLPNHPDVVLVHERLEPGDESSG